MHMKRLFIALLSVLALAGCRGTGNGNGNYDPADARTFGLTGDVKEVLSSVVTLPDAPDEESWVGEEEPVLAFDEQGRVTLDGYGNVYEYNADGSYAGPYSDYVKVTRDASGRLASFDNTEIPEEDFDDFDVMSYCRVTYEYDAQGRVATETYSGWEWGTTTTYTYDGNKLWPAKATTNSYDEGYNENSVITYEYLDFDARGNWTKREATVVTESYEEGAEDEKETSTQVKQEIRSLSYWSGKE